MTTLGTSIDTPSHGRNETSGLGADLPPAFGRPLVRSPWWLVASLLLLTVLATRFDGRLTEIWRGLNLPGDVDQELRFLQQFGQIGSLVLVLVLVCCLQRPAIRRTLLDLGLALLLGAVVANLMKTGMGRLRPAFGDAGAFLGPWWTRSSDDFSWTQRASMPSSHVMAATVLATWMWTVCPRLRILGVALTGFVGLARVRFGAHWPSDVFAGAMVGLAVGPPVIGRLWGTRLLDLIWRRLVDRQASPAWPEVLEAVERRRARTDDVHQD